MPRITSMGYAASNRLFLRHFSYPRRLQSSTSISTFAACYRRQRYELRCVRSGSLSKWLCSIRISHRAVPAVVASLHVIQTCQAESGRTTASASWLVRVCTSDVRASSDVARVAANCFALVSSPCKIAADCVSLCFLPHNRLWQLHASSPGL